MPAPFSLGVNLPWKRYGCDFGSNAWRIGGLAVHDNAAVRRALDTAREAGADIVRWFVFCDGRAGLDYDAAGLPARLQPAVFDDMARALDIVGQAGLRLVPVLFDFHWAATRSVVNGVQLGGRGWMLRDPQARLALVAHGVKPLLAAVGHDPRIALWDLCNEPEWMARPRWALGGRVGRRTLRRWLGDLLSEVRRLSPHPVTVGLASAQGLRLVETLDLDVWQVLWYDRHDRRSPLTPCPAVASSSRPMVLGEFPSAGSRRAPLEILAASRAAGYAGAWGWSLLAQDSATSAPDLLAALRQIG